VLYDRIVTKRPELNRELIHRVLGKDYLELHILRLTLIEEADAATSRVKVETIDGNGRTEVIEGEGVGLVDGLFSALLGRYALEYQSLETIELANFKVNARLDTKNQQSGVDAVGEVTIEVRNSERDLFTFSDASRSITSSTARAVLAMVEYFVNAERAFVTLYKSLQDAQERNRSDLVSRYTREMAEVVKSTSYTDLLESMKKKSGI